MIVLAIETATPICSVALLDESRLIAERTLDSGTTHAERLALMIESVLKDGDISAGDLNGIAISIGPGSFTGLRIGLSVAKGLCFGCGCPLVAVSTLDALAWRVPFSSYHVCPTLDARKKEVYACLYEVSNVSLRRLWEPIVVSPDNMLKRIERPTVFLGNGAKVYRDEIVSALGKDAHFAPKELFTPSAGAVARLGLEKLEAEEVTDLYSVQPVYLRKSETQLGI